ncbi:hypothetical protein DXB52_14945 [Ruminococcus sp. OM04-4AA]|nr:hypothetical protein DXB52_14945 [Ruminococcus sp. OM04-4AA]
MKKIIYFDENSATDYLVMKNGGALVIEEEDKEKYGSHGEIKAGAKLKLLFNSLFVKGDAAIDSNIGVYTSGQNLIKTTITNTTLSDFLDILDENSTEIMKLEDFQIYIMENSIVLFSNNNTIFRDYEVGRFSNIYYGKLNRLIFKQ